MEIVISDSSTLILLTKSKFITDILLYFEIIIPTIVYKEIIKGKEQNYSDAFDIEYFVAIGKIRIKDPSKEKVLELSNKFNIVKGELHAVALCLENKNRIIFMDDKKGIRVCNLIGIKVYTALTLLNIFYKSKIISKKKADNYFLDLKTFGRYTTDELNITKKILEVNN